MATLLLATRNDGKVRELREIFTHTGYALETLASHPEAGDVPETGSTFGENAELKAVSAARATAMWALGEDSGLEVDALRGAPGVRSARFAGPYGDTEANNAKLLVELEGVESRSARFVCAMALASPDGEVVATSRGTCEGVILEEPQGKGGFGYDPLFKPEGKRVTMAELPSEQKSALSHRGRAARAILPLLAAHLS